MISIPVSVGELFDKITILQIKMQKILDSKKRANIEKELMVLDKISDQFDQKLIQNELNALMVVNQELWKTEDNIRIKEKQNQFDSEFIELARAVYKANDKRSEVKRKINEIMNSEFVEEKSYG